MCPVDLSVLSRWRNEDGELSGPHKPVGTGETFAILGAMTLSFAVMPIIRARYPDDWEAIALRIKHEAKWCCQQCQRPCRQPSESLAEFLQQVQRWRQRQTPLPAKFAAAPRRYLLTVAHLDQQPSNQDPSNLKALCTVCHLRFDSQFRAKQRRLKAEFLGQLSLDDAWQEGLQLSLLPAQIAPFSVPRQGEAPAEGRFLSPPRPQCQNGDKLTPYQRNSHQ